VGIKLLDDRILWLVIQLKRAKNKFVKKKIYNNCRAGYADEILDGSLGMGIKNVEKRIDKRHENEKAQTNFVHIKMVVKR
jgi:hypothetical protein